jgi:hypothetical protein
LDKIHHYGLSFKLAKELVRAWYEFESLEIMLWLYQIKNLWVDRIKHLKHHSAGGERYQKAL